MKRQFNTHEELMNEFKRFMSTTVKVIENNANTEKCDRCFAESLLLTVNAEVAAFMNIAHELEETKPE